MGKNVLITGGAGFIGSALSKQLQEDGHAVAVLDNLSFGRRHLAGVLDDRFFEVDIRAREATRKVLADTRPEIVLHLAAVHFIPYCNQHPVEAADININGTINVLDAAQAIESVEQVFVASTAAVYPIADGAMDEQHVLGPMDIYGTTKLATEKLASEFHLRTGIPTIVGRFFNAFGPNETNPHLFPEIQRQVLSGARTLKLGNLDPKRDYIHTEDMSRAMSALLSKGVSGYDVFNIGRGIEYSVREIVAAFERQLGEPLTIEVDPARVRKVERQHLLADVRKLKAATGWEPKWDIDQGVATLLTEHVEQ
ncbi:MAG TPA: NAD(P)-dependent oxidoreductase [Flavobacteriales bacterium]|nr:NAD(P)-dependent oxidoreductase [Flavobacteriales bacterium]HMW96128.1 NAD(P)-dependent oxidoreductase [Flavobacteriales bacterium]HMZ48097.1 NAD(P)-dependent oxidoreductase [Flavobacteriales bacterium]HNA33503.1 NAD(P)-dependent oxidoreductase [Flavobacteriales bacterium]HNI06114.1 NAD(P)-dependent oxidoreductase [Flavobacteriales bacterium]